MMAYFVIAASSFLLSTFFKTHPSAITLSANFVLFVLQVTLVFVISKPKISHLMLVVSAMLVVIGAATNFFVEVLNEWRMPVEGKSLYKAANDVWVPMRSYHHMTGFADHLWLGMSPGDVIIMGGAALFIIRMVMMKRAERKRLVVGRTLC